MKKKDYLKLCEKLGAIREHATNHIFAFLFNKGANVDNPYKCDIKLHETMGIGVSPLAISMLCIDEGEVYFAWDGDDECTIELDALSTEELLALAYETI